MYQLLMWALILNNMKIIELFQALALCQRKNNNNNNKSTVKNYWADILSMSEQKQKQQQQQNKPKTFLL